MGTPLDDGLRTALDVAGEDELPYQDIGLCFRV
jgi:hypothetical protein